jgi:hypothetical protein
LELLNRAVVLVAGMSIPEGKGSALRNLPQWPKLARGTRLRKPAGRRLMLLMIRSARPTPAEVPFADLSFILSFGGDRG